ncbi:MAG: DUF4386 domain-containing protein [Spirochaetia bacterium]
MSSERNVPRFLGGAFLLVICTSLLGGLLFSAPAADAPQEILTSISRDIGLYRVSIIADLFNSGAIVALAALLFTVLSRHNRTVALVALGLWLCEAFVLAVSKIGAYGLIPISGAAGSGPAASGLEPLVNFLYYGLDETGYRLHMFFYCLGGILWYILFAASRYVPRIISIFGVAAACAGLIGIVLEFFGYDISIALYLPIGVFELAIGIWLVIRGIPARVANTPAAAEHI